MKSHSRLQKFWAQFSQNRGALTGLFFIVALIFLAVFAPWIAPFSPTELHDGALRLPPFWSEAGQIKHLLGTDDLGRDLLSRLIHGSRVSMAIGFSVVTLSLTTGTMLGMLAGFFGGWVDKIVMRIIDILMALPSILLAIVVVAILGPGLINAIVAVSIVAIPNFTRIVRASVMAEIEKEYVQASRSFGASPWRTLFKEVMPNCMAPLIVQASLGFSDGILNAAALGFLGLGAQPPTPEWGIMLSDARIFISTSPWMVTLPGLFILVSVLGFNLLGDGLRDALDPRLKGQ